MHRGWRILAWAVAVAALVSLPLGALAAVQTGIDVLQTEGFAALKGKRVGLITNPTGVNQRGEPTWRLLRSAPGVTLVALFGAEHGFDGKARAGMEVPERVDPETAIPIHSLYGPGPTRKPTPKMLQGLDVLVYDLQDTGCRSYTFISTLGLAMEACGAAGISFMVLDRPNPLGGVRVEGPGLDPKFKSFVGHWPVPYVYGLTPGELARMINEERWNESRCHLEVVRMRGWKRSMTWKDTGLRWIPSSPNVPSGETPMYLVATGILGEIGGVNLATGSPLSFQVIGAPWLDAQRFSSALNRCHLQGISFEACTVDLNHNPADGPELRGARVRITRPASAPLLPVAFHALETIKSLSGRDLFQQAVNRGRNWEMFDKVTGSDATRRAMQRGRTARQIVDGWRPGVEAFLKRRQPYLLYIDEAVRSGGASTNRTQR